MAEQASSTWNTVPGSRVVRSRSGVLAFLTLTFAWSWSLFGLAIVLGGERPDARASVPWAIGALGPTLVAVALTRRAGGNGKLLLLAGSGAESGSPAVPQLAALEHTRASRACGGAERW